MFSQSAEYALRAMVWLAENHDGTMSGHKPISEATQVPESYLSKIMQQLVKSELVISKRGVGGGFLLARPVEEISLLQVVNAVDPVCRIERCPLNLASHQKQLCPIHAKLDESIAQLQHVLEGTSLSDVLYQKNFPVSGHGSLNGLSVLGTKST